MKHFSLVLCDANFEKCSLTLVFSDENSQLIMVIDVDTLGVILFVKAYNVVRIKTDKKNRKCYREAE